MGGIQFRFWCLAVSLTLLPCAVAAPQDEGDIPLATRSDADFGDATAPLKEMLRQRRISPARTQHFCIAGYQSAAHTGKRAWIVWKEGRQILLWNGATDPVSAKTAIARSRRVIDLRKHVVANESAIKGSTYLVTRAWVDKLTSECESRGEKYEITRR